MRAMVQISGAAYWQTKWISEYQPESTQSPPVSASPAAGLTATEGEQ